MGVLGDIVQAIFSPMGLQLGGAGLSYLQQQEANRAGREANEALQRRIEGTFDEADRRFWEQVAEARRSRDTGYGNLRSQVGSGIESLGRDLYSGYYDRANTILGGLRDNTADLLAGYGSLSDLSADRYGQLGRSLTQGYGGLSNAVVGGYRDLTGSLTSGLQERYERGLSNLEGAGEQARRDIDRDYRGFESRANQSLVDRGLSASTIRPTMQLGVERERQGAVGRLNEAVRRERSALDAQLSGDILAAQERLGGARLAAATGIGLSGLGSAERIGTAGARSGDMLGLAGLSAQQQQGNLASQYEAGLSADALQNLQAMRSWGINADQALELARLGDQFGLDQASLNWIGQMAAGRTNQLNSVMQPYPGAPDLGAMLAQIGMNTQQSRAAPSADSSSSWLPGAIAGGSSIASAAILATLLSDRRAKRIVGTVEDADILESMDRLDVSEWEYRGREELARDGIEIPAPLPAGRHIGPTAQDFRAAFGLGDSDQTINVVDALGVAIAAIKALSKRVKELEAK